MEQNISFITTDDFGKKLKEEYSPPTDQNKHIDYFYFRGSEDKHHIADKIVQRFKTFVGDDFFTLIDQEWLGFTIIKYPLAEETSEDDREKTINKKLRSPIASDLTDTKVIFSRACLYHSYDMNEDTIQASDIGKVMKQGNAQQEDTHNTHQDFFYLTVRIKPQETLNVSSFLRRLPGNWKKLEPHDTWPDTFLGHFPKSPFDKTEREREARLNREVRLPLMKVLEDKLMTTYPKTGDTVERRVLVLMTRACKLESANTGI